MRTPKAAVAETQAIKTINRAPPDDGRAPVANSYTHGKIRCHSGLYLIKKILVDGGAVVNLFPEAIGKAMGLTFHESSDLMIKTADAGLTPINHYVDIELEVAGVTVMIRCYVMPGPNWPSYAILLSRR